MYVHVIHFPHMYALLIQRTAMTYVPYMWQFRNGLNKRKLIIRTLVQSQPTTNDILFLSDNKLYYLPIISA